MYSHLLINIMKYFKSVKDSINREINNIYNEVEAGEFKIDLGYFFYISA